MFTTIIVQPIFNLLVAIYALLPGHNFGLAIIIFTLVVRLAMWPLLKKQLHQAKQMRALQPEIKKIKAATKGDRQKEALMMQELYKERGINAFAPIGIMIIQLPIIFALIISVRKVIAEPEELEKLAYPFLRHTAWMEQLAHNIHKFDHTLFGVVDLTRSAVEPHGIYWPAMFLVIGSAVVQYLSSKQLLPADKDSRSLRSIMKEASSGKQADQAEVNAAVGRSTIYILPVVIFLFTLNYPAALGLYWFVGGLIALVQQSIILREDTEDMEAIADKPAKKDVSKIKEAEVVERKSDQKSEGKPVKQAQSRSSEVKILKTAEPTPKNQKPKKKSSTRKRRRKK